MAGSTGTAGAGSPGRGSSPERYALYRSYALLGSASIEPITEQVTDQVPLGKAQRIDGEAYESPALPLIYSATVIKLTERDPERQPPSQEQITVAQHITIGARRGASQA